MITMGCARSSTGSGPGCVLAAEADIDAAFQMRGAKFFGVARIENLRAIRLQREHSIEREWFQISLERFIEGGTFLAVQHGVVNEIWRSFGLVGGDELDECFFAHRLERVIQAALLPDRGISFFADGFSAERACAVSWIDEARVGQRKQFGLQ